MMKPPFDPGSTPILFTNTSDEECPPHAVVACHSFEYISSNKVLRFKCRRPTAEDVGSDDTIFAFNGPTKVLPSKEGACVLARHAAQWAKVDPAYDFGQFDADDDYFQLRIGPIADQWHLHRDGAGFVLVGVRDDAGNIHEGRVLVLQDLGTSKTIFVNVTTQNSALDFGDIKVNTFTGGYTGGGDYLKGKFCDHQGAILPGNSDGYDSGDPIEIYPAYTLRGYMTKNCVLEAVKVKVNNNTKTVYFAIHGGIQSATGTVITAAGTDYTVRIGPVGTGGDTVVVPAVSVHGDEYSVGQDVSLEWQRNGFNGSRLRINDWSCPVVESALFG